MFFSQTSLLLVIVPQQYCLSFTA